MMREHSSQLVYWKSVQDSLKCDICSYMVNDSVVYTLKW